MLGFKSPENYKKDKRKFVWIQVGMSFFNDTTIRRLERKEHGSTAIFAYIKLLTQACKFDGELRNDDGEPIKREDFCLWFTTPDPDELEQAFDLLIETNLVSLNQDGVYYLRDAEILTGSRTTAADRMRELRDKEDKPTGESRDQVSQEKPSEPKDEPKEKPKKSKRTRQEDDKNKVVDIKTGEIIEADPDPVVLVIEYLNRVTGSRYKPETKNTQKLIRARIKDGYTVDDLKKIIDAKSAEWINDEKMRGYLAPDTLFNESKAEKYLNQANAASAYMFHEGESAEPSDGMSVLMEGKA